MFIPIRSTSFLRVALVFAMPLACLAAEEPADAENSVAESSVAEDSEMGYVGNPWQNAEENAEEDEGESGPNVFKGSVHINAIPSRFTAHNLPKKPGITSRFLSSGFSLSGPVIKDKLAFFVGQDSQRKKAPTDFGFIREYNDLYYAGTDWSINEKHGLQFRTTVSDYHFSRNFLKTKEHPFFHEVEISKAASTHLQWGWNLNERWGNEIKVRHLSDKSRDSGRYQVEHWMVTDSLHYERDKWQGKFGFEASKTEIDSYVPIEMHPGPTYWVRGRAKAAEFNELFFLKTLEHVSFQQRGLFVQADTEPLDSLKLGLGVRWMFQQAKSLAKGYMPPVFDFYTLKNRANDHRFFFSLGAEWAPAFLGGNTKFRGDAGRYMQIEAPPATSQTTPQIEYFSYSKDLKIPYADRANLMLERAKNGFTTVLSYSYSKAPMLDGTLLTFSHSRSHSWSFSTNYAEASKPFNAQMILTCMDNLDCSGEPYYESSGSLNNGVMHGQERTRGLSLGGSLGYHERRWTGLQLYVSGNYLRETVKESYLLATLKGKKMPVPPPSFELGDEDDKDQGEGSAFSEGKRKSSHFTLDLGAKREFSMGGKVKLTTSVDMMNALNAKDSSMHKKGKDKKGSKGTEVFEGRRLQFGAKITF